MAPPCYIGVDLGTSGCRAVAVDAAGAPVATARVPLPAPLRTGDGGVEQDAEPWWDAIVAVLRALTTDIRHHRPLALALDATSATMLLADPTGRPLAPALMYNDARARAEAARIEAAAPEDSPARGASSSLAKLLHLAGRLTPAPGTLALHQADWAAGRLTGRFGTSDWNNCLKLGYDAAAERWPGWVEAMVPGGIVLPRVQAPGTPLGALAEEVAAATGLAAGLQVVAGTTDSTAAVIATGAGEPGDAVTCLGSTLVLKVLARAPVTAPGLGVYSHRFGSLWLAGGASNSGGAVLRQHFSDSRMAELTPLLRPREPTGLGYYPLPGPGERFPAQDPNLMPRILPRPDDDARFFQALLEGIAEIEAEGYSLLARLGAPAPLRVLTVGGGAANPAWTEIRARRLGIPVVAATRQEAAYGAALLALHRGATGSGPT